MDYDCISIFIAWLTLFYECHRQSMISLDAAVHHHMMTSGMGHLVCGKSMLVHELLIDDECGYQYENEVRNVLNVDSAERQNMFQ